MLSDSSFINASQCLKTIAHPIKLKNDLFALNKTKIGKRVSRRM
jgi:hypothetical protein